MKHYTYTANKNLLPLRLDKLATNLSGFSRSKIQSLIKAGNVMVDSEILTDSSLIILKECNIEIKDDIKIIPETITPKNMELEIIYEDEDMLVINKPAGLTVHPGAGNHDDTLVNGLIYHYKNNLSSVNSHDRPGIVHRIDRDTSGLLMIAKNDVAHANLSKQIEDREAKRSYLCLVWSFPKENQAVIKTNIGRSNHDRIKMTVLSYGGKVAITNYKLLEIYRNGMFSLVECNLETGRTHQIRVHMTHIGHSIVGDQTYGGHDKKSRQIQNEELKDYILNFKRQALHAYKLSFMHPTKNIPMNFEIPLQDDIKELVERIKS